MSDDRVTRYKLPLSSTDGGYRVRLLSNGRALWLLITLCRRYQKIGLPFRGQTQANQFHYIAIYWPARPVGSVTTPRSRNTPAKAYTKPVPQQLLHLAHVLLYARRNQPPSISGSLLAQLRRVLVLLEHAVLWLSSLSRCHGGGNNTQSADNRPR